MYSRQTSAKFVLVLLSSVVLVPKLVYHHRSKIRQQTKYPGLLSTL